MTYTETESKTSVQFTAKGVEYETPDHIFDPLRAEFSFTCDVAADDTNAKCPTYFTKEDDALTQDWRGMCWMNPPYGNLLRQFVEKAYHESRNSDCTVVCLIPVRANTQWWHRYVMKANEIRLIRGEVKFKGFKRGLWWPMCIVIFDSDNGGIPKLTTF